MGKRRLQRRGIAALRIVPSGEAPKPSRVSLQPSSMRNGSASELEELPEIPGGKITHLRSQKA